MKFEFNDRSRAKKMAELIRREAPERRLKLVHVCGTHEMTITESGLRDLLPERVEVREGPGCPVCVTPTRDLDAALQLAREGKIVATFGDMLDVPGTEKSLRAAKAEGASVQMVYSAREALELAETNDRGVVFHAVGFETTAPMTAVILEGDPPENFSVLSSHKLIPPAMEALLEMPANEVDGFIAPGHVSTIIGVRPYRRLSQNYEVPVVVGGFEPLDVLYSIALLVRQASEGSFSVDNGYKRAVSHEGNEESQKLLHRVFRESSSTWRGIGNIDNSGLVLRSRYQDHDALKKFAVSPSGETSVSPECLCPQVITAQATPGQCPLFRDECTPENPHGPCMVGEEAMCNIWYRYGGRPTL